MENRIQTVVWLRKSGRSLSDFDLSPIRHVLRRLGALQRLRFQGRSDFDDHYVLLVRDTAAMRRVFTPPVIDAWVADPGWLMEGRVKQWLIYRLSDRAPPQAIPAVLDGAVGLVERLESGFPG